MDAAVFRVPGLLNDIGAMRGLAAAIASGAEPSRERTDALVRAEFNSDRLDADMEGGLAKVEALHPGTMAALRLEPARQAMHRFHETATAMTDAAQIQRDGTQVIDAMLTSQALMLDQLDTLLAARVASMRTSQAAVAAVIAVTLSLAAYLFYCFYRVMQGGLNEVRRHLRAMTDGDLTTHPEPWGRDEAAQLMISLQDMQSALRLIVHEVREGSDEILHSSTEIAEGAMDLSSRTEQTAANLQQTAASMEEISGTVKNTAEHASQASSLSRANAATAENGGEVMTRMVRTMDGIGQSSARIGEIIGVIDGIAFQTNILALNA
ncbi:MAG: HAMP domain-containing protein, partial [Rhodoferax sp.]|nr:HAMP domain-containing protein [Rhodoferax sp.]